MNFVLNTREDTSVSVSAAHLTEVKVAYVRTPCSNRS